MDYLKEAKEFLEEAEREFEQGLENGNKTLMRDACEKGWGAVVQTTNALFEKKGVEKLPKSHRDRRLLLLQLERRDEDIEKLHIVDRVMARDHVLHMRGFYNGDIDPDEVRENFAKVRRYIEEIERI